MGAQLWSHFPLPSGADPKPPSATVKPRLPCPAIPPPGGPPRLNPDTAASPASSPQGLVRELPWCPTSSAPSIPPTLLPVIPLGLARAFPPDLLAQKPAGTKTLSLPVWPLSSGSFPHPSFVKAYNLECTGEGYRERPTPTPLPWPSALEAASLSEDLSALTLSGKREADAQRGLALTLGHQQSQIWSRCAPRKETNTLFKSQSWENTRTQVCMADDTAGI